MNELLATKDKMAIDESEPALALLDFESARRLTGYDRSRRLAALNGLFRTGRLPEPSLEDRYAGKLVALDMAPGLTQFFEWLTSAWMPWLGKTFNPAERSGDNIFSEDSKPLARLFNPFYRGFTADAPGTYRGFAFRTYVAPGLFDPDRSVLKIDYDLKENPSLTVRRVLDELVQVSDQLYLGKAHVRWWWSPAGSWQTVAYFTLSLQ